MPEIVPFEMASFYLRKAYVIVRNKCRAAETLILPFTRNRQHDTHITAGSVALSQYVDSRAFGHHMTSSHCLFDAAQMQKFTGSRTR